MWIGLAFITIIDDIMKYLMKRFMVPAVICAFAACEPANMQLPPGGNDTVEDEFALVEGGETVLSIEAVNVRKVARVVGMTPQGEDIPNPNNTLKRFGMSSTDFGNMWDAGDGTVWAVFGDNFNNRGGDWLSNAVAVR